MSQRRQRASLGLSLSQAGARDNVLASNELFDDYRRRHSKQNRDIVQENVTRRLTINTLQVQVDTLQAQLLEVRNANIKLQTQVKQLHIQAANATRTALDNIIASIPALTQLRDTLAPSPPSSSGLSNGNSPYVLASAENPTATRPAAAWAGQVRLDTVGEGAEVGSEISWSGFVDEGRKKGRRLKGETGVGSIASSRSPRPPIQTSAVLPINSPCSVTSSPSPIKSSRQPGDRISQSPRSGKKKNKRRESGLLLPMDVDNTSSPITKGGRAREGKTPEKGPRWVEVESPLATLSRPVDISEKVGGAEEGVFGEPAIVQVKGSTKKKAEKGIAKVGTVKVGDVLPHLPEPTVPLTVDNNIGEHQEGVDGTVGTENMEKEVERMGIVPEEGSSLSSGSDPSRPSASSASSGAGEVNGDDDGGRGRRSRKSVSYQEPSLRKKMRKPDGTTVEDALRNSSRGSLSLSSNNPPPTPSTSSIASSSPPAKTTHLDTALRRKSVLPISKAVAPSLISEVTDENQVEEDILGSEDDDIDLPATTPLNEGEGDYMSAPTDTPHPGKSNRTSPKKRYTKLPAKPLQLGKLGGGGRDVLSDTTVGDRRMNAGSRVGRGGEKVGEKGRTGGGQGVGRRMSSLV